MSFKAKSWFNIHSITGVFFGLLLFVVCWSGTFAVISNELDYVVTPEIRTESTNSSINWQLVHETTKQAYPNSQIRWLEAPLYRGFAAKAVIDTKEQQGLKVFIDPSSGQIISQTSYFSIQRFFRSFHMSFFDVGGIGYWIIYLLSLVFIASLITPLIFWKRWYKQFVRFDWGSGRKFWSEAHKSIGVWSLLFSMLIALTALWYLIEALNYEVNGVWSYAGTDETAVVQIISEREPSKATLVGVNDLVSKTQKLRPDIKISQISFDTESSTVTIQGIGNNILVRERADHIIFDWHTGNVVYNQDSAELPVYWFLSHLADPLHFGNFGGLYSKIIYFIFSLMLCFSILSGTWLYAHKSLRKNKTKTNQKGLICTVVLTLSLFLASVHAGWQEIKGYGPTQNNIQSLPEVANGTLIILAAWVAMTIAIVVAWTYLLLRPKTFEANLMSSPKSKVQNTLST